MILPPALCVGHTHPRSPTVIPFEKIAAELARMCEVAGVQCRQVVMDPELTLEHERDPRRYAQVVMEDGRFEFAKQITWLPFRHRIGLYAHEIGHCLAPSGGEDEADWAAWERLGLYIRYDRKWPGKGLQCAG